MQFAPMCCALMSLPTPPYNPAAQHTHEGLVPGPHTTRGLAPITRTAPPAATTANTTNAADPVEAPAPPQGSGRRWGCCMLWGAQNFKSYVCVCVCLRLLNF